MPDTALSALSGRLYVVATPIGNLDDLSTRAIDVLRNATLIAAEDTRRFAILAQRFGITAPCLPYHEHNEREVVAQLVTRLRAGAAVALVSDAGTPLVSDPGYRLAAEAHASGIPVIPVPGACAAVAALSASGLATDRFVFERFLPARAAAREQRLRELAAETRTLIFYESSHRIEESLGAMRAVLGDARRACLARELTKLHEQIVNLPLGELPTWLAADDNRRRGEFVVLVAGAAETTVSGGTLPPQQVFELLRAELPPSAAARLAARLTGLPRKHFYASAHEKSADPEAEA